MSDLHKKHCAPCKDGTPPLSHDDAQKMLEQTPGWSLHEVRPSQIKDRDFHFQIEKELKFKNFAEAVNFVNKVSRLAEENGHHPDILIHGWNKVHLTFFTHAIGGLSENDFIIAAKVNQFLLHHGGAGIMKMQSINPATEEVLGEFVMHTFEEALASVRAAQEAQKFWARKTVSERCVPIKKLAQVLRKGAGEYAKILTLEMGKPLAQAHAEIEKCAWLCEYFSEAAPGFLAPEEVKTDALKSYVRFDPLGIVLAIMPWNFPFWQVFRTAVPALAAGNGVMVKHASNVPQCQMKIGEIFAAAGFPEGLFRALLIDSKTSNRLIESNAVAAITLTGSTGAGSLAGELAGKYLKKCVLELGGADPFIVLKDADISAAAKTAVAARMLATGQNCVAAKRFIVQASVAAEFQAKVLEHFQTLNMGNPLNEKVNIGPLAKADIRDALEKQVDDAVKKGARVLAGGHRPPGKGYFYEPTLLTNITPDMAVYHQETFGPVMTLITVKNAEEAIAIANDSEYGLGATIWTHDVKRAEELAAQLESGIVSINGQVKSDPRLPFGGVKKSGYGRELSVYGIKEFVNIKSIVIQ